MQQIAGEEVGASTARMIEIKKEMDDVRREQEKLLTSDIKSMA